MAFDGEGAYRFGGRWSSPGVRLAYAAEHLSLAIVEYFVHLDPEDPPRDLVVATADVPDGVPEYRSPQGSYRRAGAKCRPRQRWPRSGRIRT